VIKTYSKHMSIELVFKRIQAVCFTLRPNCCW